MKNSDILVVGSVALDSIKTPFGEVKEVLGGSATHFSCAASFFSPVCLVGVVGSDFPEEHLSYLKKFNNIDLDGLEMVEGKTFRWQGYYDYDLNQAHTLNTQLNVFEKFSPKLPNKYRQASYVFLANIDPELQLDILNQTNGCRLSCCDTMDFWIKNKPEALRKTINKVDFCLMNDSEARQLCSSFSLVNSAREILSLGPKTVIVKKGEHGALMFTDSAHFSAPAYPLEEIKDPTGAGDSFAGGFIGYLAKTGDLSEKNIRKAIIYGSVMASYNVEGFGPKRLGEISWSDIEARYNEFKEITFF